MKKTFFSLVIPVYNAEKYLEECVNSILAQTFKDFEIIFVNDGSTDSSASICNDLSQKLPQKISIINKENAGPFLARIDGIRAACGKYIAFIDADDYIKNDALMYLYKKIMQTEPDVVLYSMSKKKDFSEPFIVYPFKNDTLITNSEKKDLLKLTLTSPLFNNLALKTVRKDILPRIEDFSDLFRVKNGEDYLYSLYIFNNAEKIYITQEVLYFYRTNLESTSFNYSENFIDSVMLIDFKSRKFAQEWAKIYHDESFNELSEGRTLRKFFDAVRAPLKAFIPFSQKMLEVQKISEDKYFSKIYKRKKGTIPFSLKNILSKVALSGKFPLFILCCVLYIPCLFYKKKSLR